MKPATEIVELTQQLRTLDWSWRLEDVPELAAKFGWRVEISSADWAMLDTGFGLSSGQVFGRDGKANDIKVILTGFPDEGIGGRDLVRDAFAQITETVTAALGEPTARTPGEVPEVRWAGPETTLILRDLSVTVALHLTTNNSLAIHDIPLDPHDYEADEEA